MTEHRESEESHFIVPSLVDSYRSIAEMQEHLVFLRDMLQSTTLTAEYPEAIEQRDHHIRVLGSWVLLTERMTSAVQSHNPEPPVKPSY